MLYNNYNAICFESHKKVDCVADVSVGLLTVVTNKPLFCSTKVETINQNN